ncbi:MAG: cupin domain-containing protein [Cyanobacteria bacterium P01_H01_bin.21]
MESLRAHKNRLSETSTNQIGSKLLLSGQELSMWFWQAMPTAGAEVEGYVSQDYEVMGYVISGQAELHVDGKVISLKPGDSWVVPTGALHAYSILEPLTAVKTSHPPSSQIY